MKESTAWKNKTRVLKIFVLADEFEKLKEIWGIFGRSDHFQIVSSYIFAFKNQKITSIFELPKTFINLISFKFFIEILVKGGSFEFVLHVVLAVVHFIFLLHIFIFTHHKLKMVSEGRGLIPTLRGTPPPTVGMRIRTNCRRNYAVFYFLFAGLVGGHELRRFPGSKGNNRRF